MVIIILESIRIAVVLFIFRYLWLTGSREKVGQEPGWPYIVWGFGLILFGTIIDITDNFPALSRFLVVGNTAYEAILEKGVGYSLGYMLLALGFRTWMPNIAAFKATRGLLQESRNELDLRGKERTAELEKEIQDRKEALRVLRETEERFHQLAENVQDVFYIHDHTQTKMIYVSPAYEKIWGCSCETLCEDPLSFMDAVVPEDRATVLDVMATQRQGKLSVVQYRIVRPDGSRRWILSRSYPVLDEHGRHHRTVGVAADITDRKEAEEALRQSEHKYRQLFDTESDALFLIETETGRILEVNSAGQALYGYSRNELVSMRTTDLSVEPEATCPQQGPPVLTRHRKKDGTVFPVEITARHFELGGRDVRVAVIKDINFRVKAEEEKRKLEAELLHAQKMEAVGTLAGGIAHDFNNLLQAVQGYAELLLIKKNTDDVGVTELKEIVNAAQKGAELTRQMLTFSRKVESNKRPLDLNHELQQVQRLLDRTLPKMIEIELILADDLRLVNADRGQMQQVVMNLAVNAKDAMPEGGRLIIRTENVFLDETYCRTNPGVTPGQYIAVTVSDTGHGMDDTTLKHLFEPFFTTKEAGRGSGLGLAMVYGIVKSHAGHITCRSKVGTGATFMIYLPMLEHGAETPDSKDVEESLRRGTETVLLVDDDQLVRDFAKQILEQVGYTALTAADGEMAVATYVLHKQRIDLVILDVIMPGMGGKKSLEKILHINPHARVLLMTGYLSDTSFEALLATGAKGLLKKPFKAKDLVNTIRQVLDEK